MSRQSLANLQTPKAEDLEAAPPPHTSMNTASADPNRVEKVSLYLKKEKYKKIKTIANDTDRKIQEVLDEAMDLIIQRYNLADPVNLGKQITR